MLTRILFCTVLAAAPMFANACDSLSRLHLQNTTITAAETVAAGFFTPPGPAVDLAAAATFRTLPEFCRVQGVIAPTADSHIEFEVWLPVASWNRKYLGVGNGGFAGSIQYAGGGNVFTLADALAAGYATSSTDTGHKGAASEAQWALGHPEKITDYGYRAIHQTALASQAIIHGFYGAKSSHSYFSSCSNGGRQALMEAQRFPSDYDGFIAGAPAASLTHILAAFTMNLQTTEANEQSYIPAAKIPALDAAVLQSCDSSDGLKDGVIDDPTKCHFDPQTIVCRGADSNSCLTQPQADALKKIYAGARTRTGELIYPGFLPGGEAGPGGWTNWITGTAPGKSAQYRFATHGLADIVFQNPNWNYRTFNLDRDVKVADKKAGQLLDAVDPNLKAFKDRGGKLILFHGWSDPALAPTSTVNYYESVLANMGQKESASFMRLYMVPGMQHCAGGPGPNSFREEITAALEHWVEDGVSPSKITATKYKRDGNPAGGTTRTRPLCPYPEMARYQGTGSTDDAANFTCAIPK